MSEQYLIEHCSPTLAGIKTGSLFPVKIKKGSDIKEELRKLNGIIREKGLRAVLVRKRSNSVLVYVYRPDYLARDLKDPKALEILKEKGYVCEGPECCLKQLIKHFMTDDTFPHEIGLFLGYPPSDVKCFMESPWEGVKCRGCWKAYSNEKEAEKIFSLYKKCTENYRNLYKSGKSLAQLVVPSKDAACAGLS